MSPVTESCFMCKNTNNCTIVDQKVVRQVEYLLPEITIIKSGIPLRICSKCDKKLHAFSKFKRNCSMQCSRGSMLASAALYSSRIQSQMEIDRANNASQSHSQQGGASQQQDGGEQEIDRSNLFEQLAKRLKK